MDSPMTNKASAIEDRGHKKECMGDVCGLWACSLCACWPCSAPMIHSTTVTHHSLPSAKGQRQATHALRSWPFLARLLSSLAMALADALTGAKGVHDYCTSGAGLSIGIT